jgi:hypothetical protein
VVSLGVQNPVYNTSSRAQVFDWILCLLWRIGITFPAFISWTIWFKMMIFCQSFGETYCLRLQVWNDGADKWRDLWWWVQIHHQLNVGLCEAPTLDAHCGESETDILRLLKRKHIRCQQQTLHQQRLKVAFHVANSIILFRCRWAGVAYNDVGKQIGKDRGHWVDHHVVHRRLV